MSGSSKNKWTPRELSGGVILGCVEFSEASKLQDHHRTAMVLFHHIFLLSGARTGGWGKRLEGGEEHRIQDQDFFCSSSLQACAFWRRQDLLCIKAALKFVVMRRYAFITDDIK